MSFEYPLSGLEPRFARFRSSKWAGIAILAVITLTVLFAAPSGTRFISLPGVLIVVGGTLAALLLHYSSRDIRLALERMRVIGADGAAPSLAERISYLNSLSTIVKREGVLVLDAEANRVSDRFLKLALELAADRRPVEEIERVLQHDINFSAENDQRSVGVFETLATYAPAMGLIGTIIGLVQMLSQLTTPANLGPSLSVALLTTLYGALVAHFVFMPIAGKLQAFNTRERQIKMVTLEGIVSIAREESSVILAQRLKSFSMPQAA
jgi:chemotaxis protein MotA